MVWPIHLLPCTGRTGTCVPVRRRSLWSTLFKTVLLISFQQWLNQNWSDLTTSVCIVDTSSWCMLLEISNPIIMHYWMFLLLSNYSHHIIMILCSRGICWLYLLNSRTIQWFIVSIIWSFHTSWTVAVSCCILYSLWIVVSRLMITLANVMMAIADKPWKYCQKALLTDWSKTREHVNWLCIVNYSSASKEAAGSIRML